MAGEPLGERVDRPAEGPPLGAALLDAVDVEQRRHAGDGEQRQEEGVGRVDDERRVEALARRVETGEQRVDGGVEVLRAQRRQDDQTDAAPALGPAPDIVRATVDGDLEAAGDEPGGELGVQGLVAAVATRDAAAAEQRHAGPAHPSSPSGRPPVANQRSSCAAGALLRPWIRRRRAQSARRSRQSQR